LYSLSLGLAITELAAILLPAVWLVRLRKLPLREAWRLRGISWQEVICTLLLSAFGLPVVLAVHSAILPAVTAIFGPSPDLSGLLGNAIGSGMGFFWWLVAGALLPGICEEALFRGSILGVLEHKGPAKAVVITAVLFACFHLNPWNFAGPLVLGLVLGLVAIRSQSIVPAMIWHAATNALAFTVLAKRDTLPWWVTLLSAVGLMAAGKWFLHLTRDRARKTSPLASPPLPGSAPLRWLGFSAGAIVATPIIVVVLLLKPTVFPNDKFAPEIPRGSVGIVLRNHFGLVTVLSGDWISCRKERTTVIRRVTRVSPKTVWISEPAPDGQNAEQELLRSEITGKLIIHFNPLEVKGH
jgi:membrane protease YdiL (CAAX protease family)